VTADSLLWINAVLSGLCLLAVMGSLILLGRAVEKVETHDIEIRRIRYTQQRLRREGIVG